MTVVEKYSQVLELLDVYDYQNMSRPIGNKAIYILTSFKGSIGAIYQSFAGEDVYPALEKKAANLLYFTLKEL